MAEVGLRFNLDAEEVELTVDGQVAMSTGTDVFKSWVDAYNGKHKTVEEPVGERTVPLTTEEVTNVDNPVEETSTQDVDKPESE